MIQARACIDIQRAPPHAHARWTSSPAEGSTNTLGRAHSGGETNTLGTVPRKNMHDGFRVCACHVARGGGGARQLVRPGVQEVRHGGLDGDGELVALQAAQRLAQHRDGRALQLRPRRVPACTRAQATHSRRVRPRGACRGADDDADWK